MAIVFKQQKKKKRMSLWVTSVVLLVALSLISLIFFPPQTPDDFQDTAGDLNIKIDVLSSEQVKNLEPFKDAVELDFAYVARDEAGKRVSGNIKATSTSNAEALLMEKGLTVESLRQINSSSQEPFLPYYQEANE